jgi:hypothetical protein
MILTIRIPDETAQEYSKYGKDLAKTLEKQLERFKDANPADRTVVLASATRQALEKLFERPIEDQDLLIRWVGELLSAKIGPVEVHLNEGQKKRLLDEAKFYQTEPSVLLRKKILEGLSRTSVGA